MILGFIILTWIALSQICKFSITWKGEDAGLFPKIESSSSKKLQVFLPLLLFLCLPLHSLYGLYEYVFWTDLKSFQNACPSFASVLQIGPLWTSGLSSYSSMLCSPQTDRRVFIYLSLHDIPLFSPSPLLFRGHPWNTMHSQYL